MIKSSSDHKNMETESIPNESYKVSLRSHIPSSLNSPTEPDEVQTIMRKSHEVSLKDHARTYKRPTTRDPATVKRFNFDKSPEITKNLKSRIVRDWKLSFNEANLTNYTHFGVKSFSVKNSCQSSQIGAYYPS